MIGRSAMHYPFVSYLGVLSDGATQSEVALGPLRPIQYSIICEALALNS
jgi:hypothetical protein